MIQFNVPWEFEFPLKSSIFHKFWAHLPSEEDHKVEKMKKFGHATICDTLILSFHAILI